MTYLVDTNVWSELRRPQRADKSVLTWAAAINPSDIFLSVIVVSELERGVLRIERRDIQHGIRLRRWLETQVLGPFSAQVLPVDLVIARRCAALHVPNPRPERDALIAATALVHGLTIVTRNTSDFEQTGAPLVNPWLPTTERTSV